MNNCTTRHLAKILIHLAWCLQECVSDSGVAFPAIPKALNALFVSSVFLKDLIEKAKSDNFEELYLSLDDTEPIPSNFSKGPFFTAHLLLITFIVFFSTYRHLHACYVGKIAFIFLYFIIWCTPCF